MTNFKTKRCGSLLNTQAQYSGTILSLTGRFIQISSILENACSN